MTKAAIIDLDKTLCILNDRDPWDASECHLDGLNLSLLPIIDSLVSRQYEIIYITARNVRHFDKTREWLEKYRLPHTFNLFMKKDETKEGGQTSLEYKRALVKKLQEDRDIHFAIDDSWENLVMYQQAGIQAFHPKPQ